MVLEEDGLSFKRRRGYIYLLRLFSFLPGLAMIIIGISALTYLYEDPIPEDAYSGFIGFLIGGGTFIFIFGPILTLYDFNSERMAFFRNGIVLYYPEDYSTNMDFYPWDEFSWSKHLDHPVLGPSLQVAYYGQRLLIPQSMKGYDIVEELVTTNVPEC